MSSEGKKPTAKRSSAKRKKPGPLERSLTKQEEQKVVRAFETHCEDEQYGLTAGELFQVYKELGLENDLKAAAAIVDTCSSNGMSLDKLKQHAAELLVEKSARTELKRVFKLFDSKGNGRITRKSLRETATELGEKLSDDTISEMVQVATAGKGGSITESGFVDFMLSAWVNRG